VFALCYTQHGGSGLGFRRDEVVDLEWDEMIWYAERLERQREREAQAIRDAAHRARARR
jgi:hypothetical protein